MVGDAEDTILLKELRVAFNREVETNKRVAAETAYALAFLYRNEDVYGRRRFDLAKIWALRAIEILDVLPSDRLEQVTSTRLPVGGIALPALFHAGVVRQRLADVLI